MFSGSPNSVKLVIHTQYGGFDFKEETFIHAQHAPAELLCYALRLHYATFQANVSTKIEENFSLFEVKFYEQIKLPHYSTIDQQIDVAIELLGALYREYLREHNMTDPEKKIYDECRSIVLSLSVMPVIIPIIEKVKTSFFDGPIKSYSLN